MDEAAAARFLDSTTTSEDALFAELGAQIPTDEGFGGDLAAKGRAAFNNARATLRRHLCPALDARPELRTLVTSANSGDLITAWGAIASIIGGIASLQIYSGILAVVILRMGIRSICPNLPQ